MSMFIGEALVGDGNEIVRTRKIELILAENGKAGLPSTFKTKFGVVFN